MENAFKFPEMSEQPQGIVKRIADLVEVYQNPTIEEFLDEMFQNHLECTTTSGKPLADGYYLITQLKEIFKEAEFISHNVTAN